MPDVWFANLDIKIDKLNRVAFSLGSFQVYWYGIIIALSIIAGFSVCMHIAKKTGQNPEDYSDYMIWGIIFGIIGARAYYVIFSWDDFKDNLIDIFALRDGGLAVYGSIIGALISLIIYCRKRRLSILRAADTFAPCLSLGQAIGRWGNFINKEAFGGYTDGLFAMRYKLDLVSQHNITEEIRNHIITENSVQYIQVHPTFLYESAWNLIIVFPMLYLMQGRKKFDGQAAASYAILYGIGRFFIEGLRTDQLKIGSFAVSQIVSLLLAALGLMFLAANIAKLKR